MERNGEVHSPSKTKEKISLRRRLFIRKSTKVGCSVDSDSPIDERQIVTSNHNGTADVLTCSSHSPNSHSSASSRELDFHKHESYLSKNNCPLNLESKSKCHNLPGIERPKSLAENKDSKMAYSCSANMRSLSSLNDVNMLASQQLTNVVEMPVFIPAANKSAQKSQRNGISRTSNSLNSSPNCSYNIRQLRNENLNSTQFSSECLVKSIVEISNKNDISSDGSHVSSLDRKSRIQRQTSNIYKGTGSMDSLARNSLLAGQVLRLIPTEQARERNFLHGRLAANSLLGAVELEHVFPEREVKMFVGTWNMNGQPPPRELNDFLFPNSITYVPDVLAIGTQESFSERQEWEISLQEALGPSHILLHSATLGTLHLSVFIRRDLIWFCSIPEDASMSVRPGTAFRTKGAVAISFSLFGSTFLFVTAHLTAHQEKVKERVQDIKRIIRSLDLPRNLPLKHKSKDVTNNFDYVLWCGDLNFRLGEPRSAVVKWIEDTQFPLPSNMPHGLLHTDQLTVVLSDGAAFRDFREAAITFPPTYKYDPGTQQFDTSTKQRAPAYTDRILFKSKPVHPSSSTSIPGFRRSSSCPSANNLQCGLACLAYNSTPSVCTSDHKPVWGLFTATLRPGTDVVPLAAGLFNREVYLEGIRRRAAILDPVPGTSVVCSIQ